jgi:tol-pal system protein YbgF
MTFRIALLLFACGMACAELPPVVDKTGGVSGNPNLNSATSPSLSSNYEMMKRIGQMQAEIQQLTGKVEEQAFQIEELKKQQKTMYTDFDDRIQSMENKSSGSPPPSTDAPADPSSPADPTSGSGVEGGVAPPSATDQPTSSSPPKDSPSDASGAMSAAPAASATKDSANAATSESASAQVPENEKQEYQQAYDDLRNGRTSSAITGFNAYITNHPGSAYASNAQYWLGEAHRVNMDNTAARKAFNSVIETYPKSAKVPDALLKLGYIEMEEKNPTKAREILTRVTTEFPSSKAAALAQKKMLTLDKITEKTAP